MAKQNPIAAFRHRLSSAYGTDENRQRDWLPYVLLVPTVLFIIGVLWFPFVRGIWMSFHDWPFTGEPEWVGLANYRYLFDWGVFYTSLQATVIYASMTVIQLALAMGATLLLANMDRFKTIFNGMFLIPYTLPGIVSGVIWLYLLEPDFGPILQLGQDLGVLSDTIYWASSGDTAMAAIVAAGSWTFWPFMFLILYAAREGIPDTHYESAQVYGANKIQQFLRVTLPQLKTAILVAVSIRVIWNLSKVAQPWQMTGGGPGFETSLLSILLYRMAYSRFEMGLAYSIGIVLLIVVLFFIFLFIREFLKESEEVEA